MPIGSHVQPHAVIVLEWLAETTVIHAFSETHSKNLCTAVALDARILISYEH